MTAQPHAPSYYAASANPAPLRPALEGNISADVCIIGGGYSGCHAALTLAEQGYRVVLLEANRIGWGASGRNGGQLCTGFARGQASLERAVGKADAAHLFRLTEEAKAIVAKRIERHRIACDLTWGYLYGAPKARHLEGLRHELEELEANGYHRARLLDRAGLATHIASEAYVGGLLDEGAGHLHPLNFALGLAAAAAAAGASLHEASQVTRVTPGAKVRVETAEGSVTADFCVVACNAYLDGLLPQIQSRMMPVATYMTATAPLGEARARALIPSNVAVGDTNFVLNYFRRSADHRLLFGGGVSYTARMPASLPADMRRTMLRVFPQLADAKQDFTWGGNVSITQDRAPHLGRVAPNLYFAQGFSGQGVAITAIAAEVIAEAIKGQAERFDLFARIPHRAFPGGKYLRAPTLALAMTWFRLRDRL
jgi:gamma-glutamylputrescine oxidase